jgi:hypothetical protein
MTNTAEVIAVLRPGASASVHGLGSESETIIWHDTVQTEPTRAEIDAKRAELDAAQPWIDARTERDQLLRDSDWTAVTDTALSEADQTDWEDYRQALRDIPQTYDDADDVVWPDAPA